MISLEQKVKKIQGKWEKTLVRVVKYRAQQLPGGLKIFTDEEKKLVKKARLGILKNIDARIEKGLLKLLEKMSEAVLKNTPKSKRKFVVLSGPSGAGKGTYGKELEQYGFNKFPTTNTRLPRPTDRVGIDFVFVSVDEFKKMETRGDFLQARQTHGDWHGISRVILEEKIKKGEPFYLERSAFSLTGFHKKMKDLAKIEKFEFPNYLSVFFLPPSFAELYTRLTKRTSEEKQAISKPRHNTLSDEKLLERFETAIEQLKESARAIFDLYIVNDTISRGMKKILKYKK